ncbi:hypothetical protein Dimus_029930 [Dionaea muscipula]
MPFKVETIEIAEPKKNKEKKSRHFKIKKRRPFLTQEEAIDTEAIKVEAIDTEAIKVEAIDTKAIKVKAIDTKAIETRDGKICSRKDYLSMLMLCQRILCKDDGDSLEEKGYCEVEVRGVDLEFDNEKLATILGVHSKNGICEYIKEVWEESKYTKPLEITRRFANDATIMKARRVQSIEMKPSQRFIHFTVMKNVIPRFGKRDTSSFLDLTYMDHLMARRLVDTPRVMMRHMSYVISMKDHELPYGDWLTLVFEAFGVPLVIKKGEEPKKYDFFEDTFLTMCKPTGEDGIWWIGSGENRRRDDDEATQEEEAEGDDEGNKDDFGREAIIDEASC